VVKGAKGMAAKLGWINCRQPSLDGLIGWINRPEHCRDGARASVYASFYASGMDVYPLVNEFGLCGGVEGQDLRERHCSRCRGHAKRRGLLLRAGDCRAAGPQ